MPSVARRQGSGTGGKLSIGALSRATGIPIETLRTWERRYGFPVPDRKPSGHRLYPLSSVPRLRRIAEALGRGHRAAEVVGASEGDLTDLLRATSVATAYRAAEPAPPAEPSELLRYVEDFDAGALTRQLLADWALLGPLEFLRGRVAPLIRAVGDAWESGRLEVRHEHFLSERVGDLLRTLRLQFEERATGPLVIFTSLPGESHGLGLQMAALVLGIAGCRVLNLGTETPVPEVATLANDLNARVVAVSVSAATRGRTTATHLTRLRNMLPRKVILLVGGDGAPRPRKGLLVIQDLGHLDAWGRRMVADGSELMAHGC
jgi:methanogenic corrinoid protein MtbC1